MTVRIRFFAHMAQRAGTPSLSLTLPEGATARDVQPALQQRLTSLFWPPGTLLAINQQYAAPDQLLHEADEIAIIPPVSGG